MSGIINEHGVLIPAAAVPKLRTAIEVTQKLAKTFSKRKPNQKANLPIVTVTYDGSSDTVVSWREFNVWTFGAAESWLSATGRHLWTQKTVAAGSATITTTNDFKMCLAVIDDTPTVYLQGTLTGKAAADTAQLVDGGSLGEPAIGDVFQYVKYTSGVPVIQWNNTEMPVMLEKYNYNSTSKVLTIYGYEAGLRREWGGGTVSLGDSFDDGIIVGWTAPPNAVGFDEAANYGDYDDYQTIGQAVTDASGNLKNAEIGIMVSNFHPFGLTSSFPDNNGNTLTVKNGLITTTSA